MNKRGPRRLRRDERELWARYTTGMPAKPEADPEPVGTEEIEHQRPPIPAFKLGERVGSRSSVAVTPTVSATNISKIDQKTFGRLKRGQIAPEARIDLHGMTVADAHSALAEFIFRTQAKGLRLVLVITGRGNPNDVGLMPIERGVLRRQVPEWLRLAPLGPLVMDITPAHRKHGGDGALYVYLRRRR